MTTTLQQPFRHDGPLSPLGRFRELTLELTRREVVETYGAHLLGGVWGIAHPVIMMVVYFGVFGVVFEARARGADNASDDYVLYLFSGLVPWLLCQQAIARSADAIIANARLVKQVVFPVQVLPVRAVLASLITGLAPLVILAAYALVRTGRPDWTWLLVPVLLVLQVVGLIGIGYALSALVVFARDLREIIRALLFIGTFFAPILYRPDWVPGGLHLLLYLNPFSYVVWCYHDACFHGRLAHPWAWLVFAAMSVGTLLVGSRLFHRLRPAFANVL